MSPSAIGDKGIEVEEVGSTDAARSLPKLLGRAEYRGERFLITRHGAPAAALVPIADLERLRSLDAVA